MIFEDRILKNPRLLRLKDPRTNEIVDFEIQDLLPEEIIQEGTEVGAEELNGQIVNEHSESTSNVYSASYINPQAIFCKLSADTTITNTYTDVNNWVKQTGVGNKLTISDGKIRIGAGINHVKVSVKIWGEVNSSSLIYTYIRKNNSNVDGTWQIHYVVQGQPQCIYNQCIVDVQEGDIITISLYGNGEVHSDTSIIVDKLD